MKSKYSKSEIEEQNHFNLMAKKYDINYGYDNSFTRFKINKKALEFKKFVMANNLKGNVYIVELGCGTGEYTKKIAEFLPKAKILAIDISEEIIEVARQKCRANKNVRFKVVSAYDTGLSKSSVDFICGFYFLHHVNLRLVNKEIFRILKKSGAAFFYEPNILNPVVYAIKSNTYLKKRVGDSPNEWAINPVTLYKSFPKMKVSVKSSEFVPPLSFLPFKYLKLLDNITSTFSNIPLISYLGGSLVIKISK